MTSWTLLRRNLRHHARSHLATWLGAAVGAAIVTGALLVGDSVRGSLREMSLARLGRTTLALGSGDRFFRSALAGDLERALGLPAVPVLKLDAVAAGEDGSARANHVQLLGVDERFWKLGQAEPQFPSAGPDEVLLNDALARQLHAAPGDTILLRVARPSALSREAPLTPQSDSSVALRLTVAGLVPDQVMGRFSLQPSQVPPFNAFVHLGSLQERLRSPGKANQLLLAAESPGVDQAQKAILQSWQLADAELELRQVPGRDELELRTPRVFLDEATADAASHLATNATRIITYFVNALGAGDRSTPYSMVTAAESPLVPRDLGTNGVIVNDWLANDLAVRAGDEIALSYYVVGTARRLEEKTARFRVHSVVPLSGGAADPTLMPEFPGLEKAETTRDWDATLPVALDKIRPQDERYWKDHRGTPKAFLALDAGAALWRNRFGTLTAIRYPVAPGDADRRRAELESALRRQLDPAAFGLRFEPVRGQALAAASQSQDFGSLFLGFSFFLIAAALLLTALLHQFSIEQRSVEVGTLLALGFTGKQVRRLLLLESGAVVLGASLAGSLGGVAYARFMVRGLSTIWRDAVGTSALQFHGSFVTWLIGAAAGAAVATFVIWISLRRQATRPARQLLAGESESDAPIVGTKPGRLARWLAIIAALAALGIAGSALRRGDTADAGAFFGAGMLWLVAGLAGAAVLLRRWVSARSHPPHSLAALGWRQVARRRGRSLVTIGLLACGSFLVAAIGVFRLDAVSGAWDRGAGTGGFALLGESTFPVIQDLNTQSGREAFALEAAELRDVSVVAMRVREGDDASCLNLNRAQQPRLLGVNARLLAQRHAFTFAKVLDGITATNAWAALDPAAGNGSNGAGLALHPDEVPAIGDFNSIRWAMHRHVGDAIDYTDERGRKFRVRLVGAVANSILQGQLLIGERAFLERFPSESGYRMFLVDAPSNQVSQVSAALSRGLRDFGLELTPAADRLAAFNAVQNTYLGTFQLLGGLGLILGSVGLGVVVLRNVLERRGELAVFSALGFRAAVIRRMVVTEHVFLLVAGLVLGIAGAVVAVLPAVLSPAAQLPLGTLSLTLGGVLVSGLLWTWIAAAVSLRGELLAALHQE